MNIAVNESSRPPYVKFEIRPFEDREKSQTTGKYCSRDVDYVVVRQAGNRDSSEFEAQPWLERISKNEGYKPEWVENYRLQYNMWKKGHEPSPTGTHVRSWPAISPSQAEMLTNCLVLTVEDLAAANEQTLAHIGIGARELKMKAKAWLDSAQKVGVTAEELASTREHNAALLEQNNLLRQQLHLLQASAGVAASAPAQPVKTEQDPFA